MARILTIERQNSCPLTISKKMCMIILSLFALVAIEAAVPPSSPFNRSIPLNAPSIFPKLDEDCLLLIFENLDLANLIITAQTNHLFFNLASDVFERRFSRKTFKFQAPTLKKRQKILVSNEVIITDIDTIAQVLRTFGRLIRVLKIRYERFAIKNAKEITKCVNKFCAEHLAQLGVSGITWRLWQFMRKPFANTKDVAFSRKFETSDGVNLNRIFPVMRKLILLDTVFRKSNLLERSFYNLEHLYVGVSSVEHSFSKEVEKLLKKNAKIRQLSVRHYFRKFLEQVDDRLQQIETMELLWPQDDYNGTKVIKFEGVRRLLIKANALPVPERIIFPKVEEIECFCFPELSDACVDFLKENRFFKKLNVTSETRNEQFMKLAGAFPNLEVASILIAADVKAANVIEFLMKSNKIDKLILRTSDELLVRLLRIRVTGHWKFTEIYKNFTLKTIELQRIK